MSNFIPLIIFLVNIFGCNADATAVPDYKAPIAYEVHWTRLQKKLTDNYTGHGRPVKNGSTTVKIEILPLITRIMAVDEEEQTLTISGTMHMEWTDEYLTWNIQDYDGVNEISLFSNYIWIPDIMLYNSAYGSSMGTFGSYGERVSISEQGRVVFTPKFQFKATCFFDFSNYPYDVQKCPLVLGSWSYTLKMMELAKLPDNAIPASFPATNTISKHVKNWEHIGTLVNITFWNAYAKVRGDEKPPASLYHLTFPEYTVWITIKRFAPYYCSLILAPALVTSAFTLVFYWCSTTRLSLGLSLVNIALQMLFMDNLMKKLPPSNEDKAPGIVRYYAINLSCTVLSTIIFAILDELTTKSTAKSKNVEDSSKVQAPKSGPPKVLKQLAYARQQVVRKLDNKFGFERQLDERDEDHIETDQSETSTSSAQVSSVDNGEQWAGVKESLRIVAFLCFFIIYVISAIALLW